jgi:oligopeptide/dipeptide ABC transporter ATP-binding protein
VHRLCSRSETTRRVGEVLEQVGLAAGDAQRYPHEFSGGQRQRVAIARAVVARPRLVVVDEALSALDTTVQVQILALLLRLQREMGVSYLFVSHHLNAVRAIAHRTAVMYAGRIIETGPTADIFSRPLHPYTQTLLAANAPPDPAGPLAAPREETPALESHPAGCPYHPRCPYAADHCRKSEPAPRPTEPGREAACHLLDLGTAMVPSPSTR